MGEGLDFNPPPCNSWVTFPYPPGWKGNPNGPIPLRGAGLGAGVPDDLLLWWYHHCFLLSLGTMLPRFTVSLLNKSIAHKRAKCAEGGVISSRDGCSSIGGQKRFLAAFWHKLEELNTCVFQAKLLEGHLLWSSIWVSELYSPGSPRSCVCPKFRVQPFISKSA